MRTVIKSSTYFHSQATEYGLAHTGRRKRTARRMTLAKARFHLRWVIFLCAMFLESWSRFLFFSYRPIVYSLPRSFPFISQVNNLSSSIIWNHTLLELLFGTDIYPVSTDYILIHLDYILYCSLPKYICNYILYIIWWSMVIRTFRVIFCSRQKNINIYQSFVSNKKVKFEFQPDLTDLKLNFSTLREHQRIRSFAIFQKTLIKVL